MLLLYDICYNIKSMANRHLARSTVLQALYQWDFRKASEDEVSTILHRCAEEFAPGIGDFSFMESLMSTVIEKIKELDSIIIKAAPDWPLDKISLIDKNILRIGLAELLFSDRENVPPKVAINEAIELSKTFGNESSFKFVNGVLGAVYREMGEPGKNETSKKKNPKQIPVETLGGSVVFAKEKKEIYIALVHDVFGHWTLSKGHIDPEADIKGEVAKAIKDELGLKVEVMEELGHTKYGTYNPEKGKIKKQVRYFLSESEFVDLKLKKSGGLDDAKWFRLADIIELNFYDDILPVVTKAINILVKSS